MAHEESQASPAITVITKSSKRLKHRHPSHHHGSKKLDWQTKNNVVIVHFQYLGTEVELTLLRSELETLHHVECICDTLSGFYF
ncbi:hypothetical protein RIF29_30168 [Crotalaria pallida]|uniref:Uncharacterized protein n=1 Tax=Crotalaria pallida TaxID=3830 RepID=A0AAN9EL05_CROPI